MKTALLFAALGVFALAGLPSATVHSQAMVPAATDPLTALANLQRANVELIKRQNASLQDLIDMTTTAHEARIFSKRG